MFNTQSQWLWFEGKVFSQLSYLVHARCGQSAMTSVKLTQLTAIAITAPIGGIESPHNVSPDRSGILSDTRIEGFIISDFNKTPTVRVVHGRVVPDIVSPTELEDAIKVCLVLATVHVLTML